MFDFDLEFDFNIREYEYIYKYSRIADSLVVLYSYSEVPASVYHCPESCDAV